jgi:photosystem II stability/assembly factor-like uncharacterized protein
MSKKLLFVLVGIVAALVAMFAVTTKQNAPDNTSGANITPASSLRDAHGLAVDVEDPGKVYIASHTGLYMLQNDKDLYRVGNARDDYMGFSAHPTDPNIFFTSGHPARGGNLGFQKSTDGGKTWQKVSDGLDGPVDFHSMAVDQIEPDTIYGVYRGRMQKSTDGGQTWSYADDAPDGVIQLATGATKNTVYAATEKAIQVSRDQAETWSPLSTTLNGPVIALAGNPASEQELLSYSQQLGLAKSTDGGRTWSKLATPFGEEMVLYIAFDKSNPATIYILTRSLALYKTTDGGQHWNKIR